MKLKLLNTTTDFSNLSMLLQKTRPIGLVFYYFVIIANYEGSLGILTIALE